MPRNLKFLTVQTYQLTREGGFLVFRRVFRSYRRIIGHLQPYSANYTGVQAKKCPGDKRSFYRFTFTRFGTLGDLRNYPYTGAGYHMERYRCGACPLTFVCEDKVWT